LSQKLGGNFNQNREEVVLNFDFRFGGIEATGHHPKTVSIA